MLRRRRGAAVFGLHLLQLLRRRRGYPHLSHAARTGAAPQHREICAAGTGDRVLPPIPRRRDLKFKRCAPQGSLAHLFIGSARRGR